MINKRREHYKGERIKEFTPYESNVVLCDNDEVLLWSEKTGYFFTLKRDTMNETVIAYKKL